MEPVLRRGDKQGISETSLALRSPGETRMAYLELILPLETLGETRIAYLGLILFLDSQGKTIMPHFGTLQRLNTKVRKTCDTWKYNC